MGKLKKEMVRSVAMRTTLILVLATTFVMVVSNFIQIYHVNKALSEEVHRQASKAMDAAITEIDNRVSNVEMAVMTAASYAYLFAPEEAGGYLMLQRLILSNKDISAATLLYRENFFPEHGRYFAPTVFRNHSDTAIEDGEIGGPEHDFCYLETDSNWVYTNKLNAGYWCLPYVDSISTKRPMVTYSVPLHEPNGDIYAVLCADIDLRWVKNLVNDTRPYNYSLVSVLSRDGKYICHPNPEAVMTVDALSYARQENNPDYVNVVEQMLRWSRGSDTMVLKPELLGKVSESKESIIYYAPVERVKWSVSFTLPISKVMEGPKRMRNGMLFTLLLTLICTSLVSYLLINMQLRPMKELANSLKAMTKGNFNVKLPVIKTKDEIQQFRDSFEEMQHSLNTYVEELKITTASKASIESELSIAHDIQMAMIPKVFPPFPERNDIQLFASLTPAKAVGGDLYDYFIRDEKLFFVIGDVSGKGVPASLVMAVTRSLFRTLATNESRPLKIVTSINHAIAMNNDSCMFVTLFVGVLDLPTGRLRFCNAGHDAPYLTGTDPLRQLETITNIPVGLVDNYDYKAGEFMMTYGNGLFLYTDGLTEAENLSKELLGNERLDKLMQEVSLKTPEEQVETMLNAVRRHADGAVQSDDLTLLAIRYLHRESEALVRRTLTLKSDRAELAQLAGFVEELVGEANIDDMIGNQIDLALDEAVSNVVLYAYPEGTEGFVNIEAVASSEKIKFIITDNGKPFDPTATRDPDITLSAEERPIGGLGIYIVRQVMDSVNYEFINGKNVLTLRKKLGTKLA